MKQSLSGVFLRLKNVPQEYKWVIEEFLKNFETAKKAHETGDEEVLKDFFNTYVVEGTKI